MSESIEYDDLVIANLVDPAIDTMSRQMGQYLIDNIKNNKNILIVGANGSGKTLLLNTLSRYINMENSILCMEMKPEILLLEHNSYHIDLSNVKPEKRIKDYFMISKGFPYYEENSFVLDDVPKQCYENIYNLLMADKQVIASFEDDNGHKLINSILFSLAQKKGQEQLKPLGVNLMEKVDIVVHIRPYSDGYIRVKEIAETKGFHPANNTIMLDPVYGYMTNEEVNYEGKFIGEFVRY